MVFVESLTSVDTAQDSDGQEKLGESDEGLKHDEDDCEKAEDAVGGSKVRVVAFVHLDDGKGSEEADDANQLNAVVDACAEQLLLRGCSGLQN